MALGWVLRNSKKKVLYGRSVDNVPINARLNRLTERISAHRADIARVGAVYCRGNSRATPKDTCMQT